MPDLTHAHIEAFLEMIRDTRAFRDVHQGTLEAQFRRLAEATADTIEPDPGRHEEYRFYVDRYMEAYPQMKELMHKTERHVAGRTPAAGE